MGFNRHDITRNQVQLFGKQAECGYDWWWHSFSGRDVETGEEKSFFIEFFLCNPAYGQAKPVFGKKPSYLMIKAGTWGEDAAQIHRFYGWKRIEVEEAAPFSISAGDCFLSDEATRGYISVNPDEARSHKEWMCQSGTMAWSLVMQKKIAFNVGYGANRLMRKLQAFEMFWHAEGMKTAYRGEVIWNGRTYKVSPQNCYGYSDKNWGKGFTTPWVWISSNNLISEVSGKRLFNSAFDIGGGRPQIGPFVLKRQLLSAFWHEGKEYEFNFSKFWTFCRTKFECYETARTMVWHIEQKTLRHRMVTDITCRKKDMLLINYASPDGERRHTRLWNGGTGMGTVELYRGKTLIDKVKVRNAGCEYGEYDATSQYRRETTEQES